MHIIHDDYVQRSGEPISASVNNFTFKTFWKQRIHKSLLKIIFLIDGWTEPVNGL